MADRAPRPPRPQTVLEVVRRERLTPHLVRVVFGGPGFEVLAGTAFTDRYVKIFFADPALGLEPPYDLAALRESLAPAQLPVSRTYTIRSVDPDARTLAIDFVVHGDEGLAGPWAARAEAGQRISLSGPGGAYLPDPETGWHLFAGDESALPAIAAALERLAETAPDARGAAYLEVTDAADELALTAPSGVAVHWLHRGSVAAGTSAVLAEAVAAHPWDSAPWAGSRVQVFAHGEREAMKALRDVFFARRGLERSQVSLSGYWAHGRTEDRFQAEKREPIGVILPPAG